MRATSIGVAACVAIASLQGVARGQTEPRLVAAMRSAQDGQGDSARAIVSRMLAGTSPTDSLYPQILYTAAMTSDDGAGMRRQLQRITVEYPASGWADDASLRLAQLDYAGRDLDAAARDLERIRQDYPDTPLFAEVSYWAARVYLDQNRQADACRWVAEGVKRADDNIELRNQLDDMSRRCGVIVAAPDTSRSDPPASAPAEPTTVSAVPRYRIQIAAVGSAGSATTAERRARAAGFPTVVTVKENGLLKVRVGGWSERKTAQQAVPDVKAKLGGTPYVVEER